ncbi:serpin B4-like isoform X1 [Physella acuta]|uniref:serpin B4-like isoform X1 n=1 Tax=Physella acuta TaxID=109671 RepID=UPI0027DAE5B6|nr:serpin B4-like isoform X1 [Physella acuta]
MKTYIAVILAIVGQLVAADPQQQLALSAATSGFSQRLYQKVALNRGNVVYSPYSIHSALSMTSLGARGETATEMAETLGVSSLGPAVHTIYKELITQLNSNTDVEINTGNAIFVNPRYTIVPQFVTDVRDYYFAKADYFDLSAPGGPERKINDYIYRATKNTIMNTLKKDFIKQNTVMLLVNTLFFNGTWKSQFPKQNTRPESFYKTGGLVSKVNMMNGDFEIFYKEDATNKVDVAELPFKGSRFSLFVALPNEVDGIIGLEQLLATPGKADELFTGLEQTFMSVSIPKFTTETEVELSQILIDLGMVKAFNSADFSGMVKPDAVIDKVIHKTKIVVMETGTVAAAATVVSIVERAAFREFKADHPFLYFIRDKVSGHIFFQGKFSG